MSDALDTDKTMQPSDVPSPSAQLSPGTTLGQYGIIKLLGRGGMGEVYEVEHRVLRRKYALKLLPADFAARANALERFEREARVMANLEHPNIIRVDDFGETEGRYWLRMELAEGGQVAGQDIVTIEDYAEALGGRIPQDELLEILKQVVSALDYAHQHGAIHRDLKPSNILLAVTPLEGGEYLTVPKISDFGLVRLVGEEWVRSQAQISVQRSMSMGQKRTASPEGTSTRSLLGTYEYMSPEQKRGEDADERSDIYSLGLIAFRLLTGHEPALRRPSEVESSLLPAWDKLVTSALTPDPSDRTKTCGVLRAQLDDVQRQLDEREMEQHALPLTATAEKDRIWQDSRPKPVSQKRTSLRRVFVLLVWVASLLLVGGMGFALRAVLMSRSPTDASLLGEHTREMLEESESSRSLHRLFVKTFSTVSSTLETGTPAPRGIDSPARDISPCTAEILETPELSDFWMSYPLHLEERGLATMRLDIESLHDAESATPTLEHLAANAIRQSERLDEARSYLTVLREEMMDTIDDLNSQKGELRVTLKKVDDLNAEIGRLNDEIAQRDDQFTALKKDKQAVEDALADRETQMQ